MCKLYNNENAFCVFSGMTFTPTSTEQCLSWTAKSTHPNSWVFQSKLPRRNSKSQRKPSPGQIQQNQLRAVWNKAQFLRTNFTQCHVKNVTLLLVLLIWMKCITFLMCFQVSRETEIQSACMCIFWMGWVGGGKEIQERVTGCVCVCEGSDPLSGSVVWLSDLISCYGSGYMMCSFIGPLP